jgi:hypothetical protein
MYITSASPNKRSLGSVNGLAQLSGTFLAVINSSTTNVIRSFHRPHHRPGGLDLALRCLSSEKPARW